MRLNIQQQNVISGGATPIEKTEYKTTSNSKIVQILTSGLYLRPKHAIVRELCTNALDSHILAGKADVPFEVTLPNIVNPWLIVRDFGVSMSKDTMFNIYGVLGESTKTDGNGQIGGWGLGGKSPMAYHHTFFITTYKDNVRRIYQSSCLSASNPLELVLEGPFEAPDGVEVKVPIQEKDFNSFVAAAQSELAAFDVKPIIKGGYELQYSYDLSQGQALEATLDIPNDAGVLETQKVNLQYHTVNKSEYIYIRMGCVVYPVSTSSEYSNQFGKIINDIRWYYPFSGVMFDLPVDAVDIKPSREDLDYTDRTVKVILDILNTYKKHTKKDILSFVWSLRKLPIYEALQTLYNCTEKYKEYILKKYGRILTPSGKYTPYGLFAKKYSNFIYSLFLEEFSKTEFCNLKIFSSLEGKITKNKIANFSVGLNADNAITVIERIPRYFQKTTYADDNNLIPSSGMTGISAKTTDLYYSQRYTAHIPTKDDTYFCLNTDEIAIFKKVLTPLGINVHVYTPPEIPKEDKKDYVTVNSKSIPEIKFYYIVNGKLTLTKVNETYSLKSIQKIIDEHPSDNIYIETKELGLHYRPDTYNYLFSTLRNQSALIILTTRSLKDKVLASPKFDILDFSEVKYIKNILTPAEKEYLIELYIEETIAKNFEPSWRKNGSIYSAIKQSPSLFKWFFSFATTKCTQNLPYEFKYIISNSKYSTFALNEADRISNRICKRIELLIQKYPILLLLNNSPTVYEVEQLFSLINPTFKEVVDADTRTEETDSTSLD